MNMKKYWILAVAALAACNNETLVENAEVVPEKDVAIGFGTGMYNMTRAENSEATTKYALSTYHNTFYVWGYKRVEESDTEHNYITVFNGIDDVVDGAKQSLVTWGTDWTYAPARFWDKSASYYNFYAVAPSQYAWKATDNDGNAIVNANMVDEDDVKFSLAAFTTDGLSLKQNALKPTPSDASVFATSTSANPDLMISNDIIKHNDYTGNKVNFEFNHILSRLNIAVKKDATVAGTVKITELKVYNLKNKGDFQEAFGTTGLTAETLKAGTDKRWTSSFKDSKQSVVGIAFKNLSTAAAPTTTVDAVDGTDYIGGSTTSTATNIVTASDNFYYQGLVIPQTAKYVPCKMNGTDVYDAANKVALSTDTDPFIKISYTIDGEPFVYYYNLAEVFSNVNANVEGEYGTACYTTLADYFVYANAGNYYYFDGTQVPNYAYYKDGKYYSSDLSSGLVEVFLQGDGTFNTKEDGTGEVYPAAICIQLNADNTVRTQKRSEVDGECDITFCEGWQNNLWITIKPTTIQFAAEVYEWATKEDNNHTIE